MLHECIKRYKQALADNDQKEMRRIENDLAEIGMYKITLMILIKGLEKVRKESICPQQIIWETNIDPYLLCVNTTVLM